MRRFVLMSILTLLFICASAPPLDKVTQDRKVKFVLAEIQRREYEKEFNRFLEHLRFKEGSNRWDIINTIGCMGYYQFHPNTLRTLGYGHITPEAFRQNPNIFPEELQDKAIKMLIEFNELALSGCMAYVGKTIKGVEITKSGLIGAAHLAGSQGVKMFFQHGYVAKDLNGTTVIDYLREFAGFEI